MSVVGLDPYGPVLRSGTYTRTSPETKEANRLCRERYKIGDTIRIMRSDDRGFTNGKEYVIIDIRWGNPTGWLRLMKDSGIEWYTLWYHIYDVNNCINECTIFCPLNIEGCPFYTKREEGK